MIPRDTSIDSTLGLLTGGYTFISNRCERFHSDAFETRLVLRTAVCMRGEEAASVFYEPGRFTRRQAMPQTALRLLQDKGSVQALDGADHLRRKEMFLSILTGPGVGTMTQVFEEEWRARLAEWQRHGSIVLLPESESVLCRAACRWAGIPLSDEEAAERTREFAAMIDGAGSAGPRNWRGLLLRERTERWMRGVVERIRAGSLDLPEDAPARAIALHRDAAGKLLDTAVAAVELINIVRPTVAISRYIAFAALAMHLHPECVEAMRSGGEERIDWFVQEVRRFYPFFPVIAGRVMEEFEWRDRRFARGDWALLDLYGTDHDPASWSEPHRFRPERFRDWNHGRFNFIPQGGGDYAHNHRCPGEEITIAVTRAATRLLLSGMAYTVPEQDLQVDLMRMPAAPASGMALAGVRAA